MEADDTYYITLNTKNQIDALETKIVIYIEPSPKYKYTSRVEYFVSLELLVGSR